VARKLLGAVLVLALAGVAGFSRAGLDRMAHALPETEELLYLPNGKHLRIMSLGHASLLADLIYLWAIQHYSNYEQKQRQRYVEHVFADVITELDPHYVDAYWLGALILVVESGDVDAGIALLEKGADRNPDKWILPYLAAWESYHAKQFDRARVYFERAALVEGAPTVVRRMRAGLVARSGDLHEALSTWRQILEDPKSDALSTKIARRKVAELETRVVVQRLQQAVGRFRIDNGRWPSRLEELVERAYIGDLPLDVADLAYVYDPMTGEVSSTADRVLGEK
jgi:tetratricopeptide (TPR) repeat protein